MDMSIMQLTRRTFPFILSRIIIYGLFGLVAFIFLGIMVGIGFLILKMFGESGGAFIIVMILAFLVIYGGLRFLERYVLYMVKLGHVSVIVELLKTGEIPDGKGMVAHGKDQVTKNFGSANVAFLVDSMVHAAIRQIQRWITRIGNVFRFIPGSQYILGIINAIMSVALGYIDEAIMSYIFLKRKDKDEVSVWKYASDGVVLYAQSWKGIIKAAIGSVAFIYLFNIIFFLIFVFPLMFVSKIISSGTPGLGSFLGFLAIVGAYILTTLLKRALVDPIVTIMMIRAYQMSIRNLEPAVDLQQKLLGISPRFKRLFNKAQEDTPPIAQN